MKSLLVFLLAMAPALAKSDTVKLGSNSDPIRQMLFASQPIKELVSRVQLDGGPGPFQSIADASKLIDQGKKGDAVKLLKSVLAAPSLETRIQLWTWTALRALGENPDPRAAYEVLGVVLEMRSGDGYDTLAAYADGTARYLNFSGKAVFWDRPEPAIAALCKRFIDSTITASNRAKPRSSLQLPKEEAQITLLTRSGIYSFTSPPKPIVEAGAALMIQLIQHAKEQESQGVPK